SIPPAPIKSKPTRRRPVTHHWAPPHFLRASTHTRSVLLDRALVGRVGLLLISPRRLHIHREHELPLYLHVAALAALHRVVATPPPRRIIAHRHELTLLLSMRMRLDRVARELLALLIVDRRVRHKAPVC